MMGSKMSPALRRIARLPVYYRLSEAAVWLFRCICFTVGLPGSSAFLPALLFSAVGGNGLTGNITPSAFLRL